MALMDKDRWRRFLGGIVLAGLVGFSVQSLLAACESSNPCAGVEVECTCQGTGTCASFENPPTGSDCQAGGCSYQCGTESVKYKCCVVPD